MFFFKNTRHLNLFKATILSLVALLATFSFFVKASAPTILSLVPSSGPQSGGDTITIVGTDFQVAPTVMFGGNSATDVTLQGSTTITAKVPAHAPGKVNVTVMNTDGQFAVVVDGYTYNYPPTITSVSPNAGSTGGGDVIMITGANFFGVPTVLFGNAPGANVTLGDSSSLSVTTPAHGVGLVDVTLLNPDGQSATLVAAFTFSDGGFIDNSVIPVDLSGGGIVIGPLVPGEAAGGSPNTTNEYAILSNPAPTISAVTPSTGNRFGGDSITITGTNFVSTPSVKFGGISAMSTIYQNSTTLVVTTPANATGGSVSVVVTNPDGQGAIAVNGFTYSTAAPTMSSITPNVGSVLGGDYITIVGTGFYGTPSITIGGASATGITVRNSNKVTAYTPDHSAGTVDVVLTNPDSQSVTLSSGFTYASFGNTAPTISSISPSVGTLGTAVTITGTNFLTSPKITIGSTPASNVALVNGTTITANVPAAWRQNIQQFTYPDVVAYFNSPANATVDSSGNIYVLDRGNNRIQKFTSSGTLLATWGSSGSGDGQFNSPQGIFVDSSGNVYVADTTNNRIQKFTSSGTFLAKWGTSGSGDGQFNLPYNVAVDSSGNVYVADTYNNRVQKFNSSGTFLAKWGTLGTGDGQFNYSYGISVDSSNNVYVTDYSNDRIQKFNSSGTFLAKWGSYGSGNGQFDYPAGLSVDSSGNIYVADFFNNRIQKFTSSGTFVAKWGAYGAGDGQFNLPSGVAIDSSGNSYVADTNNNRIQKFNSSGTFVAKWASYGSGNGQLKTPYDATIDSSGNIYVADTYNYRIQKFTSSGTFVTQWGSSGTGDGQFNGASGVTTDSSGNIYVADTYNNRIQKFTSSGTFVTKWGSLGTGDGQFSSPPGITVDSAGNVYVADVLNNRIQKFTSTGTFISKWGSSGTGDGQFDYPYRVAVDSSNNVYVVDKNNNRIQKFTSTGTFIAKWGSYGTGDGQFGYPFGIAVEPSGNVYVADRDNSRIQKFTSSGTFIAKWGSAGTGIGQFQSPYSVATDSVGNVYAVDTNNHRIQIFATTGTYDVTVANADGQTATLTNGFVYTALPSVVTSEATNIATNTATLNAIVTSTGGENPTRFIEWGTSSGSYPNSCNQGAGSGSYSCNISGLTDNTIYYYRAKATNSMGTTYGEEKTFATQEIVITIANPNAAAIISAKNSGYITVAGSSITQATSATFNRRIVFTRQSHQLTIPKGTVITKSDSQIFDMSQFTLTDVSANTRSSIVSSVGSVDIGVPNINLNFSLAGSLAIAVGSSQEGKSLAIQSKSVGQVYWASETTCQASNGVCVFSVTHATVYTANLPSSTDMMAYVRLDRLSASMATGGMVCAKPNSEGTEASVAVSFPVDFSLNQSTSNWTVNTANLPNGAVAWPGIDTASSVLNQDVTFPSGNLEVGQLYCFQFSPTNTLVTSGAGNNKIGTISTLQSGGTIISASEYAVAIISNDQISLNASVLPIISTVLDGNTDAFESSLSSAAVVSTQGKNLTIATNADSGWVAWVKSANAALNSASAAASIPSPGSLDNTPTDLASATGYVLDVNVIDSQVGSGTVSQGANYGAEYAGANITSGGKLSTTFQSVASCSGTTDGDVLTFVERAKISSVQPAASDYRDTLTIIVSGRF